MLSPPSHAPLLILEHSLLFGGIRQEGRCAGLYRLIDGGTQVVKGATLLHYVIHLSEIVPLHA